jgi:hypothetical protein
MTDAANTEFTTEQLWSQARGNATAFVLTTFAFLRERDIAVDDYVLFFGRRFAPGWDSLRAEPAVEVARAAALNAVSVGCTLGSLSGDEKSAEVLVTGWQEAEDISDTVGLEPNAGDAMWDSFHPIMERLGINYAWRREDGVVRLTFERDGA